MAGLRKLNLPLVEVLTGSLLLHVVAGLALGGFILFRQTVTPLTEFVPPPELQRVHPERLEYKVKMQQQQKQSAKPRMMRIQVASPSSIALPQVEIAVPEVSASIEAGNGVGGEGGLGEGLGSGGALGMGKISVSFFDIKGELDQCIFCIDISGSMVQQGRDLETFDRVVKELDNTLTAMSQNLDRFNVVVFAKGADLYSKDFVQATPAEIGKVLNWLDGFSPASVVRREKLKKLPGKDQYDWPKVMQGRHQGTNVLAALKRAFALNPSLVYVLSDGSPTGKKPEQIHQAIAALQQGREQKTVIHGIAYHANKGGEDFLEALANLNSGRFKRR